MTHVHSSSKISWQPALPLKLTMKTFQKLVWMLLSVQIEQFSKIEMNLHIVSTSMFRMSLLSSSPPPFSPLYSTNSIHYILLLWWLELHILRTQTYSSSAPELWDDRGRKHGAHTPKSLHHWHNFNDRFGSLSSLIGILDILETSSHVNSYASRSNLRKYFIMGSGSFFSLTFLHLHRC